LKKFKFEFRVKQSPIKLYLSDWTPKFIFLTTCSRMASRGCNIYILIRNKWEVQYFVKVEYFVVVLYEKLPNILWFVLVCIWYMCSTNYATTFRVLWFWIYCHSPWFCYLNTSKPIFDLFTKFFRFTLNKFRLRVCYFFWSILFVNRQSNIIYIIYHMWHRHFKIKHIKTKVHDIWY